MSATTKFAVIVRRNGRTARVGYVKQQNGGMWTYRPAVGQASSVRWRTPQEAIGNRVKTYELVPA